MSDHFGGPALFLDRSDINTDEIIPAKYLTEISKEALKPYCLEDLSLEGFDHQSEAMAQARVIVTRKNFGCGSSREHAPWVFEVNDIKVVIAESFARIFRQNMYNCGMMAIELAAPELDRLFELAEYGQVHIHIDVNRRQINAETHTKRLTFNFDITPFDMALVNAGGWINFVDTRY
ncbi:MAG: 3-isopropylmalate dehydratase small subunit [Desulfuromonadales bacterium]|nr:3-isopropylmalate dehydratase small subunit [Desulfuromonadales bacterium]MBN2792529.1 3-isopropylmalate dehydratase small subunit [Desulfuromonadales bacterium]